MMRTMKLTKYFAATVVLIAMVTLSLPGCVDFSFDDPQPSIDSTSMSANTTIAELKSVYPGSLFQLSDTTFYLRDSIIIEGTVISDDKEGNFYKSIFIEDSTGGIEVKLNKTTLYNDYKRGQKVVVFCNDLYLGDYGGQIQLGSTYKNNGVVEISGLEGDPIIREHVFKKGKTIQERIPTVLSVTQLNPTYIGMLVKFENVQIRDTISPITREIYTYADNVNKVTVNHSIHQCGQAFDKLVLRTSGYARFASKPIQTKNGSITGVLTYYNGTYQLLIRDTNDVDFTSNRCSNK